MIVKKSSFGVVLAIILLINSNCLASPQQPQLQHPGQLTLFDVGDAERIILVAFNDATIDRTHIKTHHNQYRQQGDYQSSTWRLRVTQQLAEKYHLTELSAWPISELGMYCIAFLVSESDVVEQVLQKMSVDNTIDLAQKMQIYQTQAHYSDPYFKLQRHMHDMQISELHKHSTGKNISIALVDTGVDHHHPELQGQVTEIRDYVEESSPTFTDDIHGTAIAGVMVARTDNNTGIVGIAPNAKLFALKACWPLGKGEIQAICNSFTLAMAINTAIKLGAHVLNLSLTGGYDPLIEKLLNIAIEKDMIIVVAKSELHGKKRNFPASLPGVIAVSQTETVTPNHSETNAVFAPGQDILTTLPHASYDFISGSSLSAAHISAIVALLLENNQQLKPEELKILLKSKAINEIHTLFQGNVETDLKDTVNDPEI